jgi:hypothetical protein
LKTRYKDIFRLVVPKVLLNENVKSKYEKATFSKEKAKEAYPSDVEFIAFGHPLLTSMIEFCKRRDDYFGGGSTAFSNGNFEEPGIIFNHILRYRDAKGSIISEDFLPVFVNTKGKVLEELVRYPIGDCSSVDKREVSDQLTSSTDSFRDIAMDYAYKLSTRFVKRARSKREREVRIKREDTKRYFEAKLHVEKKRLVDYTKKGMGGKDMVIAIRRREGIIKDLETAYKKVLNELEQEQTIYAEAPELLNVALVLPS